MAAKHPYVSGTAGIVACLMQFRKSFPATVTAETLTKLGIAPNNETYIINILRFVGAIDKDGAKTQTAGTVFSKHNDDDFAKGFAELVKTAYSDLFDLHGDDAWSLDSGDLIAFFRGSDQTSDLVGRRQATTFQTLAAFAGHGEVVPPKASSTAKKKAPSKPAPQKKVPAEVKPPEQILKKTSERAFGLTVRVEVNLPASADQVTYDKIFKSIRENLLDGS